MRSRSVLYGVLVAFYLALTACSQGTSNDEKNQKSSGESGGKSASEVVGYYTYSDPTRGSFSLALLEKNRFLLVTESAPGIPQGAVGWYALRDDTIHLSSDGLDAEGRVGTDILHLRLGSDGGPQPEAETGANEDALPFQRQNEGAKKDDKQKKDGSSDKSSDSSKKSSDK